MTDQDRELLEKAAKAAGYEVVGHDGDYLILHTGPDAQSARYWWSPLADDADALRLAVKLKLHIEWWPAKPLNCAGKVGTAEEFVFIDGASDPYAATRRAIVRAAASLTSEGKDRG